MAQSSVAITAGSGTAVDVFTTSVTGNNRQSIVVADPTTDAAAAKVNNAVPGSSDYGLTVRQVGLPAAAALADTTATPTLSEIQVFPAVYNGATWDMLRGDKTNGVFVNIKSAFHAGATGSAVPSSADYEGLMAKTALPSAATDGNLTGVMGDKFGRTVSVMGTVRDLRASQATTISTTTETTIVTAAASVFNDLVLLLFSNTSATAVRVDIRDTTGGTVIGSVEVPANGAAGFSLAGESHPQTTVNTNWTAQLASAVTDIRVWALYEKNK